MIFNRVYKKKETCGEYEWRHFACGWCAMTFMLVFAWNAEHLGMGIFWPWLALVAAAAVCLVEAIIFFTKAERIFLKPKRNDWKDGFKKARLTVKRCH